MKKVSAQSLVLTKRPKQSYTHVVAYTPTASREGAGQMLKSAKKGGTIAVKKAPDDLRGAEKFIKKNAPKVRKLLIKQMLPKIQQRR